MADEKETKKPETEAQQPEDAKTENEVKETKKEAAVMDEVRNLLQKREQEKEDSTNENEEVIR